MHDYHVLSSKHSILWEAFSYLKYLIRYRWFCYTHGIKPHRWVYVVQERDDGKFRTVLPFGCGPGARARANQYAALMNDFDTDLNTWLETDNV